MAGRGFHGCTHNNTSSSHLNESSRDADVAESVQYICEGSGRKATPDTREVARPQDKQYMAAAAGSWRVS